MTEELTKEQRICYERGHHEDEEFIDPRSGGFTRCKTCGRDVDREDPDGDLGCRRAARSRKEDGHRNPRQT